MFLSTIVILQYGVKNDSFLEILGGASDRGDRYISRNIVGHQYRGFFGISLYICCISTTSAVRFLDGVELMACSMAALSLTLYCKQTNQKLSPPSQLLLILYKCVATVTV